MKLTVRPALFLFFILLYQKGHKLFLQFSTFFLTFLLMPFVVFSDSLLFSQSSELSFKGQHVVRRLAEQYTQRTSEGNIPFSFCHMNMCRA